VLTADVADNDDDGDDVYNDHHGAARAGISQIAIIHSAAGAQTAPNFVCLLLAIIKPMPGRGVSRARASLR